MPIDIKAVYDERNKVVKIQEDLNNVATTEKRDLTPEELETWDKANEDFDSLTAQIDEDKKTQAASEKRTADLEARKEEMEKAQYAPIKPTPEDGEENTEDRSYVPDQYRTAFNAYHIQTNGGYATKQYNDAFEEYLRTGENIKEIRALQVDNDTQAGYLVLPEQMVSTIIQKVDDALFMRQLGTVHTVPKATSLGQVALENDPADFNWGYEIRTPAEDTTMSFDKRELYPHPLSGLIKISEKLLRMGAINVEDKVIERMAYKVAKGSEEAFLTGSGANKPLGIFTANAAGINTDRDISTGNTTTAIKADGLINCKYNVKPQYMNSGSWILHRDAIRDIRKLKSGDGDYLWRAGLASDRPDTILDRPYFMSEFAPNTFTSGLYVGIFGDFKWYHIADSLDLQIRRLDERYADTWQVGFRVLMETDGMPVLPEAFSRVKLA